MSTGPQANRSRPSPPQRWHFVSASGLGTSRAGDHASASVGDHDRLRYVWHASECLAVDADPVPALWRFGLRNFQSSLRAKRQGVGTALADDPAPCRECRRPRSLSGFAPAAVESCTRSSERWTELRRQLYGPVTSSSGLVFLFRKPVHQPGAFPQLRVPTVKKWTRLLDGSVVRLAIQQPGRLAYAAFLVQGVKAVLRHQNPFQ